MNHLRVLISMIVCAVLCSSCQNDGGGSEKTADQLMTEGWQSYGSHNYQAAADAFTQALGKNANLVDGYNGLGWANGKLNQLPTSVTKFLAGLVMDTTNLEIKSGLAFVYNAQKNYTQSIIQGRAVLVTNSSWSFSRDVTVNALDLQLLLAEDFFAMAAYDSSLARVKILNPIFTADVSTVAGQTALAQEIELLH
jgi:hypothetical protein